MVEFGFAKCVFMVVYQLCGSDNVCSKELVYSVSEFSLLFVHKGFYVYLLMCAVKIINFSLTCPLLGLVLFVLGGSSGMLICQGWLTVKL